MIQPMLPAFPSPNLLARMARYHVTSPFVMLWRTIEVAVLERLAARHGLRLWDRADLDIGCGNGVLGHALIREIGIGMDVAYEGVAWARHHKPAYRTLLQASATNIPLRDHSQRLVFSNSVIEHIPDGAAALDEIARVIAPGGFLALSTVSEQFPALMLGCAAPAADERAALDRGYGHCRYYSAEGMAAELSARGLRLLSSATYINPRQARICHQLRVWEQRQSRLGLRHRLNQLRRAPLGLALLTAIHPLFAPFGQGAGLAIIAQRPM